MLSLKITGLVAIIAAAAQAQDQYWIDPETVDIKIKSTSNHHTRRTQCTLTYHNSHLVL